jgi:DNA-binding winged helix-turn-helix (wHTH) protein/tetratricopeptide (TPR) repeat protein
MENKHFYEFGPFRIDPEERQLLRGDEPVPLTPKAFETLLILVRSSERVVLKEDLMKTLWPDSFVEEANLSQNIFILRKALGETAHGARYITTVPSRGYRFAEKVRQVTAEGADLVVQSHSVQMVTIEEKPRIRRGFLWAGAAVLAVGCLIGSQFYLRPRLNPSATAPAPAVRRSIAVLGFRNLTGRADQGWLSTALSEMLSTELAAGETLRLVSGEDVARAKLELPLADANTLSRDTLARLHTNLGTDLVVLGSYTVLGDQPTSRVRVDLHLQDTVVQETVADVAVVGSEADLFDVVTQVGSRLREKLGLAAVSQEEAVSVRASLPSNREAARLYSEGLARLRMYDALEARDLLHQAVAADPKYALSHVALSDAWSELGYDAKARTEAAKAYQLSGNLSREERLAVEGDYRMAIADYQKATEIYRALHALFPDNLDYGLDLAEAQRFSGRTDDALSTLEILRKLPSPLGADPRIDLRFASTISDSDHAKALAADEQAEKKGLTSGAKLLVARAKRSQCATLSKMGKLEDAIPACQEAMRLYAAAGDYHGVGIELNDIAYVRIQQGNLIEAKRLFREAAQNFRQLGNDEGVAATLANLSTIVYLEGNLAAAKALFSEALPRYRKVGDIDGEALMLVNLAEVQTDQAELRAAEDTCHQGLALAQPADNKHDLGYLLAGLGDPLQREGKLAEARKAFEQSLSVRNEAGEKQTAAESRTYLAELAIEEGRSTDAEKSARDAMLEFRGQQQADDELTAAAVLIAALLAEGKAPDAQAAVDSEAEVASKNQNHPIGLKYAIASARALAASGKATEAKSKLETILTEEKKMGFLSYQFETRLALAEIEVRSGRLNAVRDQLASLARQAQARGLGLIARKAAEMEKPDPGKNSSEVRQMLEANEPRFKASSLRR